MAKPLVLASAVVSLLPWAAACSPKSYVMNNLSDAMSETGSGTTWSGEEDPLLVRDSMPFALKTLESLQESNPKHVGLHKALASGFAQYAYAFVHQEADRAQDKSYAAAQEGWQRTRRLYHRAFSYAVKGLDLAHPGFAKLLKSAPEKAAALVTAADIELAYWCGAALGGEISLSKDKPDLLADLPAVGALMNRLLVLNESFNHGAVHSFMVNYEARGENLGGSMERAQKHFDRVVQLTGGNKAAPYVTWAEASCVPRQDMACFTQWLDKALAVDVDRVPGWRLENVVAQQRARWLKGRAADLIDVPTPEE